MKNPRQAAVYQAIVDVVGSDVPVYYWRPQDPANIGNLDAFVIYKELSDDQRLADDRTFYRTTNWRVLYYTKKDSEELNVSALEDLLDTIVNINAPYTDLVADMTVRSYTFKK